jgi:hypothetical protein
MHDERDIQMTTEKVIAAARQLSWDADIFSAAVCAEAKTAEIIRIGIELDHSIKQFNAALAEYDAEQK